MVARGKVAWGVLLCALLVSGEAHARLRLYWDCYLPNSNIDCALLATSLQGKIPFLERVARVADADVSVTLRSLPVEDGNRFLLDLVGPLDRGNVTSVHTFDRIPWLIDPNIAMVRLLTKLERGLGDFMDQKVAAEARDGRLTLELLDPTSLPYAGRPQQTGVLWYLTPGVGAYFSDVAGVGVNASAQGWLNFNYSGERWRIQNWAGLNYNEQSQPVPGTSSTASISFLGANLNNVLARAVSRDGRWSAGMLASAEKNPQANYALRANASLGLEYDVVPRLTVNQKNFGLRCALGPEYQSYDLVNVQGRERQWVGREFCDLFVSWHFPVVDVNATLGETALVNAVAYRGFSTGLSFTWRITDNWVVSPWVNVQQINQAINEAAPTNVSYTDPRAEIEASMRAAIQQGFTAPFGLQSGLSLRYLFGNGSLNAEDQRFRGVSNLR
jgi:hypothetical protein